MVPAIRPEIDGYLIAVSPDEKLPAIDGRGDGHTQTAGRGKSRRICLYQGAPLGMRRDQTLAELLRECIKGGRHPAIEGVFLGLTPSVKLRPVGAAGKRGAERSSRPKGTQP